MGRQAGKHGSGEVAFDERADRRALNVGQTGLVAVVFLSLTSAFAADAPLAWVLLIFVVQLGFLACAAWRILLLLASEPIATPCPVPETWPCYTVLVALLDEAEILPQLVDRLAAIDYPLDRLEGFLILEADDHATVAAAQACNRPVWLEVLIVPPGIPRTKPRALNYGLARARGDLVTVYDAEDHPDPFQLREAATRFAAPGAEDLVALQAPLRIRQRTSVPPGFLARHFAVEYAALFEVTLPGMARLGLPFPLGGTSNHFRAAVLRDSGGWDAHNVTEDADLGFRLWRAGGRLGVLTRPTHEPPPEGLDDWLPQRTRWLKGYMQTLGVHTRRVRGLGWRGGVAITMTLGASIASAAMHAGSVAWVSATAAITAVGEVSPRTPLFAMSVLIGGVCAAWASGLIGARRAGVPYNLPDMLMAPAYWSLLTLAFLHAAWRLVREPFAWDKTPHRPDAVTGAANADTPVGCAGREAA